MELWPQPMNVFGYRTIWTVVDAKFHRLSLTKRRGTRVNGTLVHLKVYSMIAGDSSNSTVLIEVRQRSSHGGYAFPKFDTEIELA